MDTSGLIDVAGGDKSAALVLDGLEAYVSINTLKHALKEAAAFTSVDPYPARCGREQYDAGIT